jgi:hypothetical protein
MSSLCRLSLAIIGWRASEHPRGSGVRLGPASLADIPSLNSMRVYAMAKRVSSVRVADVMTRNVVCVEQPLSVETLTSLFLERGFSARKPGAEPRSPLRLR